MTTTELAELFLVFLYKKAEEEGYDKIHSFNDFARELGIDDLGKIRNAATVLKDRGLIQNVIYAVGGNIAAAISGEGSLFVERGGDTGVIKRFKENPENYIININQSTVFHGNVAQSTVTTHSRDVSQSIIINKDIEGIISQIIGALQKDDSINSNERDDLLRDIEVLKIQLSKNKKDKGHIDSLLSKLSEIASISSLIIQLKDVIGPYFN